jgi:hypothetical protein
MLRLYVYFIRAQSAVSSKLKAMLGEGQGEKVYCIISGSAVITNYKLRITNYELSALVIQHLHSYF